MVAFLILFSSRLLTSERIHGGLGIVSISEAAHERKRRVLLELVNKSGVEGLATQGLLVDSLRLSGQIVAGQQLWKPLQEGGVISEPSFQS